MIIVVVDIVGVELHVVAHGILPRVVASVAFVDVAIARVQAADVVFHADARVRIGEQALDGDEHFGDGQRQRPVLVDRVETDVAVFRDVRVIDARDEAHKLTNIKTRVIFNLQVFANFKILPADLTDNLIEQLLEIIIKLNQLKK